MALLGSFILRRAVVLMESLRLVCCASFNQKKSLQVCKSIVFQPELFNPYWKGVFLLIANKKYLRLSRGGYDKGSALPGNLATYVWESTMLCTR